jgi:tetratricopeptide (TPR) repeat protein
MGSAQSAITTLREALNIEPSHLGIILTLAEEELRLGLFEAHQEHLAQAQNIAPDHPALIQYLAKKSMRAGKPEDAKLLYQKATALAPEDLEPRLGLLDALAATGHPNEALNLTERFILEFGEQPILLAKIIFFKRLMGEYHDSLNIARHACAMFPNYFWIWSERIQTELLIANAATVTDSIGHMPAFGPQETSLRHGFSGALSERELRLNAAISSYNKALQLKPDEPQLHWNLARTSLLSFDLNLAENHLRQFVELSKTSLKLQGKSINISQTHYGQILDEYRLDTEVVARIQELNTWPLPARIPALVDLATGCPDNIAVAVALMMAMREQNIIGAPQTAGENRIPKIIMQYWDTEDIPADVKLLMRSWHELNPSFGVWLHNDRTAREFLSREFPPNVLQAYQFAREAAQKADIFRLAWLMRNGGIYVDADNRCLQPVSLLLPAGANAVLYQEDLGTIGNDFIAVAPEHPLISYALTAAVTAMNRGDTDLVWLATGPGLITRAVAQVTAKASRGTFSLPSGLYIHSRLTLLNVMARNCMVHYRATSRNWVLSAFSQAILKENEN